MHLLKLVGLASVARNSLLNIIFFNLKKMA